MCLRCVSRWRWRGYRRMGSQVLCLRQTGPPPQLFVPAGWRAAPARPNAACRGCWAQWKASCKLAGRRATPRRGSWGWRWRTRSCGGSFSTSPTRWSSPRMDGNQDECLTVFVPVCLNDKTSYIVVQNNSYECFLIWGNLTCRLFIYLVGHSSTCLSFVHRWVVR